MLTMSFFHGRRFPEEQLQGWGFEGPTLYGVEWFAATYMSTFTVNFVNEEFLERAQAITGWEVGNGEYGLEVAVVDDLIHMPAYRWRLPTDRGTMVDGVGAYFGDWGVDPDTRGLESMSPGERVAHLRQLGETLRKYAPEAADYLESYEEPQRNPRRPRPRR